LPLNAILTIIPRSPNTINLFFYPWIVLIFFSDVIILLSTNPSDRPAKLHILSSIINIFFFTQFILDYFAI
jgi:hypothetical protein